MADRLTPFFHFFGKDVSVLERVRLKNIIILILAMLNCYLLGSLAVQRLQAENAQARIAQELSRLFSADGIQLEAASVPFVASPSTRTPVRSTEEDRLLAVFFLGESLNTLDEGGGIYTCRSSSGEALFRSNGSFEIRLLTPKQDAASFIQQFCKQFNYQDLQWNFIQNTGTASALQYVDGCPVTDAAVNFRIEDGRLTAVSGIHLPQTSTVSQEETISAATALNLFLQARRSSGAVISSISDMYPCYRLQTTSASPMTLSPAWCIITNTGKCFVNSSTGVVTLP